MTLALGRKRWASLPFGSPELAWVALINDFNHVPKLHIRDTREPMHETLNMRLATWVGAHAIEEAIEKSLRLARAALRCGAIKKI